MNQKKRIHKNHNRRLSAPRPQSLSEQYLQRGQQLLTSIGDCLGDPNREAQPRQTLNDGIDSLLQGIALDDIDRTNYSHQRGHLSEEERTKRVDEALDRFNDPAGGPAPEGPLYIRGIDGELIYLGS